MPTFNFLTCTTILVFLFVGLVQSQPPPGCPTNEHGPCSARGVCIPLPINITICGCLPGYYTEDCSKTVLDYIPGWYYSFEAWVIILNAAIIALSAATLILLRKRKYETNSMVGFFNVKNNLLIGLMILSLDSIFYWGVDPSSFKYILPPIVSRLSFVLILPLLSSVFCTLLFHWAEVYYHTVNVLKREEMLEKINARYKSEVTLEDVLSNINFVNRLKIPFIVINLVSFIVSIFQAVVENYIPSAYNGYRIFWAFYFSLMFALEGVGFLIFGQRLVSILPRPLQKKMKRMTNIISVQAGIYLFVWVFDNVMFGVLVGPPVAYIIGDFIGETCIIVIQFMMLGMFIKIRPVFPFIFIGESASGTSDDFETTGGKSGSIEVSMKMDELNDSSSDITASPKAEPQSIP